MQEQEVDTREAQALQAVLDGAHRAAVRIVEADLEGQRLGSLRRQAPVGRQQASHLGGQHKTIARTMPQIGAHPMFGEPKSIKRRRVEVTHAARPCGVEDRGGIGFGKIRHQAPGGGAAETEQRKFDGGAAQRA